jgi:hypothetical protein
MQLKCGLVVSSVLFFFLSFPVYSQDIDPIFQKLKYSAKRYNIKGTVCEQVARIELEHKYLANEYSIETGIAYAQHGRILGELDVVVFKNRDHKVALIGEVKCQNDVHKAYEDAQSQRERFRRYLQGGGYGIDFYQTDNSRIHYSRKQFDEMPPFILISQEEGRSEGFDFVLPYSLSELIQLRERLVSFQDTEDFYQHSGNYFRSLGH